VDVAKMQTEEQNKLLPPCVDFVFKCIFAKESHKRALISLLNSILEGHPVIRDITIENPEIPRDFKKGKSVALDIRATTDSNTMLQIEVQCQDDGRVVNRSVFDQSKMQQNELKSGQEYDELPDIISIWLVNYDETRRKYHTHEAVYTFKKTPLDQPEIATDKFRIFVVELQKVDIKHVNISDIFKVWVYFLTNPERIPEEFLMIPEVEEAMNELKYVSQDAKTRQAYMSYIKGKNDQINAKAHAFNKGKKEGRMEGEMRKDREAAVNFLAAGVAPNVVASSLGLSLEELNSLKHH
jgi:predicted transposase/invertase (TIGR01784 family)